MALERLGRNGADKPKAARASRHYISGYLTESEAQSRYNIAGVDSCGEKLARGMLKYRPASSFALVLPLLVGRDVNQINLRRSTLRRALSVNALYEIAYAVRIGIY